MGSSPRTAKRRFPPAASGVARARARALLAPFRDRFRVGVVWTGSVTYRANAFRSLSHRDLHALLDIPGLQMLSLYKGPAIESFRADGTAALIPDLGSHDRDFADCAALMEGMDLVLTTCTVTAHLAGSLGVALLGDRLGIRRSTAAGFLVAAGCVAVLPFVGQAWIWFLPVYLILYTSFEYAIVASFPLVSAVAPTARGSMLALSATAIGAGRVAASLVATSLWLAFGIGWTVMITAAIICASLLCLVIIRPQE